MRFQVPTGASVSERLRIFEKYLDDKYERADALLTEKARDFEARPIIKAERAEIAIIQGTFRTLFERELREP